MSGAPDEDVTRNPMMSAAPSGKDPAALGPAAPVVVPRWVQLVLLPLSILGVWAMARAAGPVLLIFVIAGLFALLLNPAIAPLRRARVPRTLAVFAVLLGVVTLLGLTAGLLAAPIGDQVGAFRDNVPTYVDDANDALADFQAWLDRRGIAVEVKEPGETALETLGARVTKGSGDIVDLTREALQLLVEASIAVILVIVLAVYMLLYGERIGAAVRTIVPRGDGSPGDDFPLRIQRAVLGYVRGQLLFSTIMGASAGLMLYLLGSLGVFPDGKTYVLFFGAFYGFAELIPYVGPAVGATPPLLIAVFSGEPLDALWLAIAFTALQQIEGHIVAPNVFAQALRINPLLVIFALLMGGQLFGIIGAFIALPIAAMLRETTVYLRRHLVFEPWPQVALAGVGVSEPAHLRLPADRICPDCDAVVGLDAEYCAGCGTALPDPDAAAAASAASPG